MIRRERVGALSPGSMRQIEDMRVPFAPWARGAGRGVAGMLPAAAERLGTARKRGRSQEE